MLSDPLHYCMTSDFLRSDVFCAVGEQECDGFQRWDSCVPKTGISNQPALPVCAAWWGRGDGDVTASAVLHALLHIWDPHLVGGGYLMYLWPQVLSSHYLHYWSPTKIEASFHQHRAIQDNTYLNFIYSLNRQDRQRVAVETKALERWCDMTRSPSRRLTEAGIDRAFLTPSPNDLCIGACWFVLLFEFSD